MTVRPIVLVLPCHSLDDFPTHHTGDEAAGLLASWTAPWHPVWIAAQREAPQWFSVDDADAERMKGAIVLTPQVVESLLPEDFQETIRASGADRLSHFPDRPALAAALADLQTSSLNGVREDAVDDELVADFYALGYWFLQIELLSRQVSYHSNLDQHLFRKKVVSAAESAVAGERDKAVETLTHCFGLLAEERDHYYPVDAYLLDLALVAPNATAAQVNRELHRSSPPNIWITGEKLEQLNGTAPELTESLASAINDRKIGLVGGEFGELPLTMLSAESLRREWLKGITTFQALLNTRPTSYFRRRFGLTPRLASVLGSFGWCGAIHAVLDTGTFPSNSQPCSQWKDKGSAGIAMLGRIPLDAALPETFLALSVVMGRSMEIDYVATVCLARWAGTESAWFHDVRRGGSYGLRLGQATTCDDFFQSNHPDMHGETYRLDQYRTPYLQQDVSANLANPISHWRNRWRATVNLEAAERLATFAVAACDQMAVEGRDCLDQIDTALRNNDNEMMTNPALPGELLSQAGRLLAQSIASPTKRMTQDIDEPSTDAAGWLMLNPFSHAQRVTWSPEPAPLTIDVDAAETLHASYTSDAMTQVAVDLSGCGFSWLPSKQNFVQAGTQSVNRKASKAAPPGENLPLASLIDRSSDGFVILQNEFCAVHISEQSGSIASLFDFHTRGNRLSQRLARSGRNPIQMRCEELTISSDTPVTGSVTTRGKLIAVNSEGGDFANESNYGSFEQTVSLNRGSRIARLRIRLDLAEPPTGPPWKNYMACRWAWPNATDALTRSLQGVAYPTEARRCESPWFFTIDDGNRRTQILTGGLPFHHRHDDRMLDNLLVVAGETEREFELAMGIDLAQPAEHAEAHWLPSLAIPCPNAPAQQAGWLFHISSNHVRLTGCTPIWCVTSDHSPPRCAGVRLRLQEQSGGVGAFRLRGPKPIVTASKTDFVQSNSKELSVNNGVVSVSIDANEWTEVACHW